MRAQQEVRAEVLWRGGGCYLSAFTFSRFAIEVARRQQGSRDRIGRALEQGREGLGRRRGRLYLPVGMG